MFIDPFELMWYLVLIIGLKYYDYFTYGVSSECTGLASVLIIIKFEPSDTCLLTQSGVLLNAKNTRMDISSRDLT